MKGMLVVSLILFSLFFFSLPKDIYSSGKTNDVLLSQQGDVLFLTTTATNSGQSTSTPSATTDPIESLQETDVFIPKGFAKDIGNLLNAVLSAVMLIGALLVFLQLILAGFYWITSGGDKGKVDSARQRLIAAIIGLIILASSFAILTLGLNFLGFESLQEVLESTKAIS